VLSHSHFQSNSLSFRSSQCSRTALGFLGHTARWDYSGCTHRTFLCCYHVDLLPFLGLYLLMDSSLTKIHSGCFPQMTTIPMNHYRNLPLSWTLQGIFIGLHQCQVSGLVLRQKKRPPLSKPNPAMPKALRKSFAKRHWHEVSCYDTTGLSGDKSLWGAWVVPRDDTKSYGLSVCLFMWEVFSNVRWLLSCLMTRLRVWSLGKR